MSISWTPNMQFVNWARNVATIPLKTYFPKTLEDLVDITKEWEAAGVLVHPLGSGWSFSDCAIPSTISALGSVMGG